MTTNFRRRKELEFVCFDAPVAEALSPAPKEKLVTTNFQEFERFEKI